MRMKSIVSAALGAIAAGVAITAAQAAPAGGVMGALRDDAVQSGVVEKATYGYGWRRRHYGWKPYYGYSYKHYGWKPHYYKYHYGWNPHYGWKHYGWKPYYGKYGYHYGGYGWQ